MAKKRDGITDLTKVLTQVAPHLKKTTYNKLTTVMFSMLHGVKFGYEEMSDAFLQDSHDIYEFHSNRKNIKHINNVVPFKIIKGGKHDG